MGKSIVARARGRPPDDAQGQQLRKMRTPLRTHRRAESEVAPVSITEVAMTAVYTVDLRRMRRAAQGMVRTGR